MPQVRSIFLSLTGAVALIAAPALAHAADFYKGKTVTIIVGFSPGGGYDSYARAVARRLRDHIPGRPTVVVQNMPGAGSLTAARSLDVTEPKDGTVMATFNAGLITQSIVEPSKVQLDFQKFSWIGVVTPDFRVCYGFGPKGVKTWDQMMHAKRFILGSTGKGSGNYINGATLREVFKAPVKQVLGFPGSAQQRIAIEQGELDGDCGSLSSIPIEWLRDHKAHPFVRFNEQRPPEMTKSAVFIDTFATTKGQKQLLSLLDSANAVGRALVMSNQVPADRVAIMRKAFDDTMKDPAFLADMKKQHLPVNPLSWRKAEASIGQMSKVSPATLALARKIYE